MVELHPKVAEFAQQMQLQLMANASKNPDGDYEGWQQFNNLQAIISEFEYHKAKLLLAIKENEKGAIREYLADCTNYLLFIGNTYSLYDEPIDHREAYKIWVSFENVGMGNEKRSINFLEK